MPDAAEWETAANRDMTSLKERKVYKLAQRKAVPPGRKRIKVMKRKADHSYKARLVAQGWNQVHGFDCGSTFPPVCRLQSVRIFVAITVEYDLDMDHMDVSTSFLYADIQEKVFVEKAPWLRGQGQGWRRASHAAREEPLRAGPKPWELISHH